MSTLQQIRDQILNKLRQTSSAGFFTDQTVLNGYINEAVEWTAVFIEYQRDLVFVQAEVDKSDYTLPSDALFIRTAYFGSSSIPGDIKPLSIVLEETLRDLFPSWMDSTPTSQGRPGWLIIPNRTAVTIFPRPNAENAAAGKYLWLNYNYVPSPMSSNAQVPDLPLPYHNLVQYYALHLCYITLQNPAMSGEMLKQFAEKIRLTKQQVTKETKEGMAFQWGGDVDVNTGGGSLINP